MAPVDVDAGVAVLADPAESSIFEQRERSRGEVSSDHDREGRRISGVGVEGPGDVSGVTLPCPEKAQVSGARRGGGDDLGSALGAERHRERTASGHARDDVERL
jgi:hypothetical protein